MRKLAGVLLLSSLTALAPLSARADAPPNAGTPPPPAEPTTPPPPPPASGPAEAPPAPPAPPTSSFYRPGRLGIGVMWGVDGVQFSLKKYLGESNFAFQFGAGFYYGFGVGLVADPDIIYEFPSVYADQHFALNWYLGAGVTVGVGVGGGCDLSTSSCGWGFGGFGGGQLVGGFAGQLKMAPVEFAVEYRPTFIAGFNYSGLIGNGLYNVAVVARYFFK